MQAKHTPSITHGFQIWRLFTAMFLHNSFLHLFWNTFSLMMIGFTVEKEMKSKKLYVALVVLGAISGNILSAIIRPLILGVGSSGSIYAILGALCIWYWLNYHRLGENRFIFLIFIGLLALFGILNVLTSKTIDIWSHLGGLTVGLPLACIWLRITRLEDEKK